MGVQEGFRVTEELRTKGIEMRLFCNEVFEGDDENDRICAKQDENVIENQTVQTGRRY